MNAIERLVKLNTPTSSTLSKVRVPYHRWTKIKNLRMGSNSKRVWLLQHPQNPAKRCVVKAYKPGDKVHERRFTKEINVLKRLKDCPFVPRLLAYDVNRCSMYLTYCGPVAPQDQRTKNQVSSYLKEMATKWHVHRVVDKKKRYDHDALFPANITWKQGKIYLIDFGSGSWVLDPV